MSNNDQQPAEAEDNPYANRNHENPSGVESTASVGVASLLGHVAGTLNEIDKKNVGGNNQFVKAKKIDPTTAYQNIMGKPVQQQPVPQQHVPQQPVPQQHVPQQTIPQQPVATDLERRICALEKAVAALNIPLKFKRGISYNVNTSKIKGTFSDPVQLLELIGNEISK